MTATAKKSKLIKSKMLGIRMTDIELSYFKSRASDVDKTVSEFAREYLNEVLLGAEKAAEKSSRKWFVRR